MPLGPGCIGPPQSPQTTRRSASTGRDGHGTCALSLRRRPPVIFRRSPGTCPCPRRSVHSARRPNNRRPPCLRRLVDHLTRFADLHQPGQTKRAPGHVLHQTLDPCPVARRQEHPLMRQREIAANDRRHVRVVAPKFATPLTGISPARCRWGSREFVVPTAAADPFG